MAQLGFGSRREQQVATQQLEQIRIRTADEAVQALRRNASPETRDMITTAFGRDPRVSKELGKTMVTGTLSTRN